MVADAPMGLSIVPPPQRAVPALLSPGHLQQGHLRVQAATGNVLSHAACGPSRLAVPFPSRWSYYTSDFIPLHLQIGSRRAAGRAARSLPPCPHPHRLPASREFHDVNLRKPGASWRAYACVGWEGRAACRVCVGGGRMGGSLQMKCGR